MSIWGYGYKRSQLSLSRKSRSWFKFPCFLRSKRYKRRDFFQKSFKNPYFLKDRLPKRTRAPRLKAVIGCLAILGIIGIFIFHPYFNINNLNIEGLQRIPLLEIEDLIKQRLNYKKLFFFDNHNIFLVDIANIKKAIQKQYVLEDLKIERKFPQDLKIVLKEKMPKLIFQNEAKFFLIDEGGKIIQETKEADLNKDLFRDIPYFQKVASSTPYQINTQAIPVATEEFIEYLYQNIPKKTQTILTYAILMDEEGRVLNLVTAEGWKIIVDRQNDWDKQIQVLSVFLRDKIKNNRSKLHYIDVRYENRSYYQ